MGTLTSSLFRLAATSLLGLATTAWPALRAQHTEAAHEDPVAALATMPAQPAAERGRVVAVHDRDGAPVVDAILVFWPKSFRHAHGHGHGHGHAEQHHADQLRELASRAAGGTRYRLDERGTTCLPEGTEGLVFAVRGRLGAVAEIVALRDGEPGEAITLTLRPAREVPVDAKEADGKPAADLELELLDADGDTLGLQATTDDRGRATFAVIDARVDGGFVKARIFARSPVRAPLPAAGRAAPAAIELPPCTRLEASLDALPFPGAKLHWYLQLADSSNREEPTDSSDLDATFARVAADAEGKVCCSVSHFSLSADLSELVAGGTTKVSVGYGEQNVVVVRMLSPAGKPLANRLVRYSWTYPNGRMSGGSNTNAEGWLGLKVPGSQPEGSQLALSVTDSDGKLLGNATPDLSDLTGPRIDLGDLRLTPPTLALKGVIETKDGRPAAGVRLTSARWSTKTADDGSFELWQPKEEAKPTSLKMTSSDWYFAAYPYSQFDLDADADADTPVKLIAVPVARLLLHAEGVPEGRLHTQIDAHCEPHRGDGGLRLDLRFDLNRDELRLPEGRWDVVFTHVHQEIHRIEDVVVNGGIENHDPRFMFFDWRSFLSLVEIRVQDSDGKPSSTGTIWLRQGGRGSGTGPRDGVLHCLLPKQGQHMTIDWKEDGNTNTIDLGIVTGDQVVRLGCGPLLTVALAQPQDLPDGVQMVVTVGDVEQALDADGRAVLCLPAPDRYRPQLSLVRGERRATLAFELPRTDAPAGGATLTVEADERFTTAFEAALGKLR